MTLITGTDSLIRNFIAFVISHYFFILIIPVGFTASTSTKTLDRCFLVRLVAFGLVKIFGDSS